MEWLETERTTSLSFSLSLIGELDVSGAATAQSISLVILNRLTFNTILDFLSMFLMHNLHVLDPGPYSALLLWHYGIFSTPKISHVTTLYNYISRLHKLQKHATKT